MLNRIAILFTVISALTAVSCSRGDVAAQSAPPPASVRVIPAVAADVPLEIAAIGNAEAISSVDVKARVTAPVVSVHFTDGQDVRAGQPLFDLDPEPLNRQISELEANIARDVANERQAEANIARDQATSKNAQSIADRGSALAKEGILAHEQADQGVANAAAAKASVDADGAALESAKASEKADRARLTQTRLQLDFTKISAPISGRAGAIAIKQGNFAKENDTTLVTILQTEPIYVAFSVPENLLPEVRKFNDSRPLTVTATTADNKVSTGTLRFIDNMVDSTTGTIRLKASFKNSERVIWPGQFVNVRATLNLERGRILISSQSVQTGPQGKYVWVLNPADSTVSMRNVTVLRLFTPPGQGEQSVVGSGLQPGESVISEGQAQLAPGARVRVLRANAAPTS